jgi:hypothetical protein
MAASIYSINPSLYNPLQSDDFWWFFYNYLNSKDSSDNEIACNCIIFLFKRKESLNNYFLNNIDDVKTWLSYSNTNNSELKKAFLLGMKELLKVKNEEERDYYNEIIHRFFSNIRTP